MKPKCGCLNFCGDDPHIDKGLVRPCPTFEAELYNKRLHAAAPELLRYLEFALDTIKGEYPEEQWPDYKVPEMEKLIANVKTSNR
jgi:hypothetical protein